MLSPREISTIEHNPYKKDFPLLAQNPQLAFLDSAATAQRPSAVLDAERHFYESMNANPLRGLYSLSVKATQAIDTARSNIARFIGAVDCEGVPRSNEVIFTRNTTESLNLVAQSLGELVLKAGDEVVISIMEHHSNLIPWQQICRKSGARLIYLRINENFDITDDEIARKIGPRTKIVSLAQVSNVLGVENPVQKIAKRAHEFGAYVVVDGAQSAPHIKVDVSALECDLFAFSAHKLMGPMGIGVLWGKSKLLDELPPFLTGGEMIDSVSETDAVWAPVPQKFEAGTQDAAGIAATGAALEYLYSHDFSALENREHLLAAYLTEQLDVLDFIELIGPKDPKRHIGSVSFNVKGVHPHDVASILDMDNVCIRAGHHCAEPLLRSLDVSSCCRASIAFYNDKKDIDQLILALKHVWQVFYASN